MEPQSIEKIVSLAIAAQGHMPIKVDSTASIAIIPNDFGLHSTEKFNQNRDRFRGRFTTFSIEAFIAYVSDRQIEGIKSFISTNNGLSAETVFNIGDKNTPGHADDLAILSLEKQPEFQALERVNGKRFSQQGVIDWFDDWADFVSARNDQGEIPFEKAVRALRKVSIGRSRDVDSNVRDMGVTLSVTEQAEAKGVDEDLPAYFVVKTESFKGLPVEELKLSLRISVSDDVPTFILRFIGEDAHTQRRSNQFIEILENRLKGLGEFYQGAFKA